MDENYGTIWVCRCCMLAHANGECCANEQHGGDGHEPLSAIEAPYSPAMGMDSSFHSCGREDGEDVLECDCETDTYSTSQCQGCGSYLHGERHAMTLFGPETTDADSTRSCGCGGVGIHGVDHDDY